MGAKHSIDNLLTAAVTEVPPPPDTVDEIVTKFLEDSAHTRKWIYNIAIALLLIVGAIQTNQAIALESWSNLVSVILNLGGVGAMSLARMNVKP